MDTQLSLNPLGVIDTVGGIFTAAANRRFQREMWADQKKYNTSERIAAQEYNTSERLATQAYNDPSAQMGRLMAAGINPNSATGMVEGVQSQPQSISGASASPSFTDQVNPLDFAQLSLIASQAKKAEAEAKGQNITNETLDETNRLNNQQQRAAIKAAESSIEFQNAQKDLTEQQTAQAKALLPLLVTKTKQEIEQFKQQTQMLVEQIENAKKERVNIEKQGEVLEAQKELTESQAGVARQQSEVLHFEALQGKFEQNLRDIGFNPKAGMMEALVQLMVSEPSKFSQLITTTCNSAVQGVQTILSPLKQAKKDFFNFMYDANSGFNPHWDTPMP